MSESGLSISRLAEGGERLAWAPGLFAQGERAGLVLAATTNLGVPAAKDALLELAAKDEGP